MPQRHTQRERERDSARADRRACFSGLGRSRSVPSDVRALAADIDASKYGCSPRSHREIERARALLSRGMPSGVLTDRDGFSTVPVFAGDVGKTDADFRGL